jgi:hypothetical protein
MHHSPETISERVARDQSTFREANEQIERSVTRFVEIDPMPFICECPRRDCIGFGRLLLEEYEMIRHDGRRFLVLPGHEICEVGGKAVARVVERGPLFSVMEDVGEAARVARQLDPRQ